MGAEVLASLGKYSEARQQLEVALRANPKNERAITLLGAINEAQVAPLLGDAAGHFLSNRLLEAEDLLRRALEIEPDHSQALKMLASIVERQGAVDTALSRDTSSDPVRTEQELQLVEPARVSEGTERQTVWTRREIEPVEVDGLVPEASDPPSFNAGLETALATAGATEVRASPEAGGRDEPTRRLDLPMTLGIATLVIALAIVVAVLWSGPTETPQEETAQETATGTSAAAEPTTRPVAAENRSADAVRPPEESLAMSPLPEAIPEERRRELLQDLESSEELEIDRATDELEAVSPALETTSPLTDAPPSTEPVSDAHDDFAEVVSAAVENTEVESAEVESFVREARAQLAAGDWEGAIELAASASDLASSASTASGLSNEILTRARAAAANAQRQAEMIGAAVEGTRFFDDAVQLVAVGNQQTQEAPLVAARSYYVASDLFRRSGEQASLRGMREALGVYVKAYRDVDFDMLSALWPTLTGARYEAIASSFEDAKSVDMKVENCSMRLTAAGGSAECELEQNYVPRRGMRQSSSSQVRFELRRRGSDWKIDAVDIAAP